MNLKKCGGYVRNGATQASCYDSRVILSFRDMVEDWCRRGEQAKTCVGWTKRGDVKNSLKKLFIGSWEPIYGRTCNTKSWIEPFCDFVIIVFKASILWADAFHKSICPYVCVCVSVCVSVCSLFEVPFKKVWSPLPEVWCQFFLKIPNPWGKVMKKSGFRFENFY